MQENRDARAIVRAEVRLAVAAQDAILQNWRMRLARRHAVEVRVEQDRRLSVTLGRMSRDTRDEIASAIHLRREAKRAQPLAHVLAHCVLLARDAGNPGQRDHRLGDARLKRRSGHRRFDHLLSARRSLALARGRAPSVSSVCCGNIHLQGPVITLSSDRAPLAVGGDTAFRRQRSPSGRMRSLRTPLLSLRGVSASHILVRHVKISRAHMKKAPQPRL